MAKTNYVKRSDVAFSSQLIAFKNNIGGYATTLGLSTGQVTAQAADANYFAYVLQCQEIMLNGAQQWGSWKELARAGGTPPLAGAPSVIVPR
jgi:hypothetical protein